MGKKNTPTRICTIRNPETNDVEWIEFDEFGTLFWKTETYTKNSNIYNAFHVVSETCFNNASKLENEFIDKKDCLVGSFPCDIDFVKDFFKLAGRKLDETKLPSNINRYPYG